MTATANPRLRLILLLGLLAAAALGAGLLLMSRSAATAEAVEAPLPPLRATAKAAPAQATRKATAAKAKAANVKAANVKAANVKAASPAAQPKPAAATPAPDPAPATPEPAPTAAPNGLPLTLAAALRRHEVVVVSLVVPGASVDELARAEAEAGAADAGAGFLALDALDRRQGGTLTAKLGVLEAPAVLVYRRPDTLFVQLDGFADRETVAQAAANARP